VEVVGYWTPEYLARKLDLLERTKEPIILCIDEKHVVHVEMPRFTSSRVVTFKKRIDVTKLLSVVERLAGVRGAA